MPRGYSARRKYPLIVALHGTDADERMIPEGCFRMQERGFREEVIFLSVFGRGDLFYQWCGEADLWEAMAWVKERYRIDGRRQYLTGLSMGGFAAWRLACQYPEQWAAIAPLCGGGDVARISALKRIPVWCVHGEKDPDVPVNESRRLVAELARLRYRHRYDELPGWGHNAWDWLYHPCRSRSSLVDWFLQWRKRSSAPPRLLPERRGYWKELFAERLVISHPARTSIPRETQILREEAMKLARFSFGDQVMRSGGFQVCEDSELSLEVLKGSNHLMLGRSDNHCWLHRARRRLLARQVQGRLWVAGESYLGKSLIAVVCQPSPWNPEKLLGIINYQQAQQMRNIGERICLDRAEPLGINVYDALQKRFIRREPYLLKPRVLVRAKQTRR